MKNVRTQRDIKLVTTEERKDYLVREPNYHTDFFLKTYSAFFLQKNTNTYEYTCLSRTINIKCQ